MGGLVVRRLMHALPNDPVFGIVDAESAGGIASWGRRLTAGSPPQTQNDGHRRPDVAAVSPGIGEDMCSLRF